MKRETGRRAYRQSTAINNVRQSRHANNTDAAQVWKSTNRLLIDTLEPRLLYSADNPLGLAIGLAEDDALEVRDAALYQTSLALAESYQQSAAVERQPLNDAEDAFVIIYVDTLEDVDDADNTDSYADFNDGAGGDGLISLREAITVANNDDSVDIIQLQADDYNLDNGRLTVSGTYIIQGVSEEQTKIIQADGVNRVMTVTTGSSVIINDLTIQGGNSGTESSGGGVVVSENSSAYFENIIFTGNKAVRDGGALYIEGNVEFQSVTVSENEALQGAGIFVNNNGTLDMYESSIIENFADDRAGGIYSEGFLNIHDSTVASNRVVDASSTANGGGGLYLVQVSENLNAETNIYDSAITSNSATYSGGGIYNRSDLNLFDSSISNNIAEVFGGGIDNRGNLNAVRVSVSENSVEKTSVNLSGEFAGEFIYVPEAAGGGIYSDNGTNLNLDYTVVYNNKSSTSAAGIFVESNASISNSTIFENISDSETGVGGFGYNIDSDETVTISNTLIAGNQAGVINKDTLGVSANSVLQSEGFNLITNPEDFSASDTDLQGLDPLITIVDSPEDEISFTVDSLSPIIDTGGATGTGDTSINGKLVDATPNIGGYVFDTQSDKVFWTSENGNIFRSDKSFTFAQKIIDLAPGSVLDIQVDETNQRLYWLDSTNSAIMSSSLDGAEPYVTERLVDFDATSFALDIDSERIGNDRFFVGLQRDEATTQLLQYFESDINGTEEEERTGTVIKELNDWPIDVELDVDDGLLYWIETTRTSNNSNLGTVAITPFGEELAFNNSRAFAHSAVENPYAMALNQSTNQVYWSEPDQDQLFVYNESTTPQSTALQLTNEITPQALAYDVTDDQLIFADDALQVYRVDKNFSSAPEEQGTVPESISHMKIISDSSILEDVPESTLELIRNDGLGIREGEATVLENGKLIVESSDTDLSADIVYTVSVGSAELEIFRNGLETDTFSQNDINEGRITFLHLGAEPPDVNDTWELPLEFSVRDNDDVNDDNVLPVSFDVTVTSVNDAPVLTIGNISVEQGEEIIVTTDIINASDADGDNEQLTFTVDSPEQGQFKIGADVGTSFTLQDIIEERVSFLQGETENAVDYTISVTVSDGTTDSAPESLQVDVSPAPVAPVYELLGEFTVDEGGTLKINKDLLSIIDTDTNPEEVEIRFETTGGTIDNNAAEEPVFTLAQLNSDEGIIFQHSGNEPSTERASVTFHVSDDRVTVDIPEIEITVTPVNDEAPEALRHEIEAKYFQEFNTLTSGDQSLLAGSTDADVDSGDDPALWTVTVVDRPDPVRGTLDVLPNGEFTYTPDNTDIETGYTETFSYTITDGNNNTSPAAEFVISVLALSPPEVRNEGMEDLNAIENAFFDTTLPPMLFTSPDNTDFTVSVVQADGSQLPGWLTFEPGAQTLSGTPEDADTGPLALSVFAIDENGLRSDTENFSIEVENVNQQPVINSINSDFDPVQEAIEGASVGTVQVTEPDRFDTVTYQVINDDRFEFDGNELKLADGTALDFEQESSVDVTVVVSDGDISDSRVFTIDVENVNDEAPEAIRHAIEAKYSQEFDTLTTGDQSLLAGSTDADNFPGDDPALWTVTVVDRPDPGRGTLNVLPNGEFTYTPDNTDIETGYTETFSYTITDGNNNTSAAAEFVISVLALSPPEVRNEGMEDLNAIENTFFDTTLPPMLFTSPDETNFTVSVVQADGSQLPGWLTFDPASQTLSGTPEDADTGPLALSVFAIDENGLRSDTENFFIEVEDVNQQPVINSINSDFDPVPEAIEGASVGTVQVTEPDRDDELTYEVIDDDRFEFDGNELKLADDTALDFEQESSVDVTVVVSDSDMSDSREFTIDVENVNDEAPEAEAHEIEAKYFQEFTILPSGDRSLLAGSTDADNFPGDDPALWTVTVVDRPDPVRGTLDVLPNGEFTYTPDDADIETSYTEAFSYTITDGNNNTSAAAEIVISVLALSPPEARNEGMEDLDAVENSFFDASLPELLFTSPDGTDFTLSVVQENGEPLPQWLTFDESLQKLSGTPDDADTGSLALSVFAIDENGLRSDTENFSIEVEDVNRQPVIESVEFNSVQENSEGASVGTIQATDFDESDTLTYEASDDRFEFVGNELKLADNTALDFEQEGSVALTLIATDDNGRSSDPFNATVDVIDGNDSPQVVAQLPDQEFTSGDSLQVDVGTFTDQDNDTLTYQLTSADGGNLPDWLVFDSASNELQLGEPPDTEDSTQLLLIVSDPSGATAQILFSVSYAPPEPELEAALPGAEEVADARDIFDELQTQRVQHETEEADDQNTDDRSSSNTSVGSNVLSQSASISGDANENQDSAGTTLSAKELFESILDGLFDANDADGRATQAQRDNVISEFLDSQNDDVELGAAAMSLGDVFNDSVNLATLFSSVNGLDNEGFSILSREISKQKDELDSQASGAKALVGSTFTVSSGLSVGYILYLLRGGAILSSVLSSLPAWRFVDPLPVLGSLGGSLDGDDESLQSITADKSGNKAAGNSAGRTASSIANRIANRIATNTVRNTANRIRKLKRGP